MYLALCIMMVFVHSIGLCSAEFTQSVAVRGILTCNGRPSVGTQVKLFDQDSLDYDDLMKEEVSDRRGQFQLSGYEEELFMDIAPKLTIIHDCNLPCLVALKIPVPRQYVTNGSTPKKIFNVGKIRLEANLKGQSFECFH